MVTALRNLADICVASLLVATLVVLGVAGVLLALVAVGLVIGIPAATVVWCVKGVL